MEELMKRAKLIYDQLLGSGQVMVLATQGEDGVSARCMSMVCQEDGLYCTAFFDSAKCAHIKGEDRVALCFDAVQIKGRARVITDLSGDENAAILEHLAQVYPHRAKYSALPGCVLIQIVPTSARFYLTTARPAQGYSIDFDAYIAVDLMKA